VIHDSPIHSSRSSTPPLRGEDVTGLGAAPEPRPTFAEALDPHIEALAFSFSKSLMLFPAAEESPVMGLEDELPPIDMLHKSSKLLLAFAGAGAGAAVLPI